MFPELQDELTLSYKDYKIQNSSEQTTPRQDASTYRTADEDPEKTKKKRGKKRQHGVRFGGTGGSDLISTSDEVPGPSTQTAEFGQTCQPRTSSKISQAIGCLRCDGLGMKIGILE